MAHKSATLQHSYGAASNLQSSNVKDHEKAPKSSSSMHSPSCTNQVIFRNAVTMVTKLQIVMTTTIFLMASQISAHPQCLDFRPPFTLTDASDAFCSDYISFGCCTKQQHRDIENRYNAIMKQTEGVNLNIDGPKGYVQYETCDVYLKTLLCQECSPYAAHIFDAETSRIKKPLPGLCGDYCAIFYSDCRAIVPYMTNDTSILSYVNGLKTTFCIGLAISDQQYCYPDILVNTDLNQEIERQTRTEQGCLCLEEYARDLRNPLIFKTPDDQTGRIFIGVQIGVVYIYYGNGTRMSTPFMDLTSMVLTSTRAGDERGLLGLAFHPDFKVNGKFYVYFTLRSSDGRQKSRLSEFQVSADNPDRADRNSERIIIEVDQPFSNHNGGELLFGTDGFIYLFLGDGGAGGDPLNHGQNKNTLLGSVIRLDIDTDDPSVPYKVPDDNPFLNEVDALPEIYAYGIRNIWRCDVDEGHPDTGYGRGRIICGDVGQSSFEEIDLIKKGGNYGWNAKEGFACYRGDKCQTIVNDEEPIYAYSHSVGNSVTGGHVYRGCLNPNLQGVYIYGDYGRGKIFSLTETGEGSNKWVNKEITLCGTDLCFNGLTNQYGRNILSFGEDYDGEIYMLTTTNPSPSSFQGKIYKFVDPRRRGDKATCRSSSWNVTPEPQKTTTTTTSKSTSQTTNSVAQQTTSSRRSSSTLAKTTRAGSTRKLTTQKLTSSSIKTTGGNVDKTITISSTTAPPSTTSTTDVPMTTTTTPVSVSQEMTSSESPVASTLPECADIVFVVDASGSISRPRFYNIMSYISDLTNKVQLGTMAYQIGLATFGNKGRIEIPLYAYQNHLEFSRRIVNSKYLNQNTNTSGGIYTMRTKMFPYSYGGRQDHPKIGILITDGRSTYDVQKTLPEANMVHKERITMYVLAFGERSALNMTELEAIASKPKDQYLIYRQQLEEVKSEFSARWTQQFGTSDSVLISYTDASWGCREPVKSDGGNGATSTWSTLHSSSYGTSISSRLSSSTTLSNTLPAATKSFSASVADNRTPMSTTSQSTAANSNTSASSFTKTTKGTTVLPNGASSSSLKTSVGSNTRVASSSSSSMLPSSSQSSQPATSQETTVARSTTTVRLSTVTTVSDGRIQGDEWSCDFEPDTSQTDQWCGIKQSTKDVFDWTLTNQRTPSFETGPNQAARGSYFIFIEASSPRKLFDDARLDLPQVSIRGDYCLSFYLHMHGYHIWEAYLLRRKPDGTSTTEWVETGRKGNLWVEKLVEIRDLEPQETLTFVGVRGEEFSGDIALDNIYLGKGTCS